MLEAALGPYAGAEFDLAGLQGLAERITQFYRDNGFPFATAILPPQRVDDGDLIIEILEGRYGQVGASGVRDLAEPAQRYLGALEPGAPIATGPLERTMYLLSDLPGIAVEPVLRPGAETGTADLDVEVTATRRWNGGASLDNHGSRFSGSHRGSADFSINRLFLLGDELSMRLLVSDRNLFLGSARYELPLGHPGLRGNLSYARTTYDLGAGFSGFTGVADVYSAGLSYAVLRGRDANLTATLSADYRDLDDRLNGTSYERKSSYAVTPGLRFDLRDDLLGGGVSFGALSLGVGRLTSNEATAVRGDFSKIAGQVARLQSLPLLPPDLGQSSLFGSLSFQSGFTRLNSSEQFSLGGASAVRAYPSGEASGRSGLVAQLELRHAVGPVAPYLFYDYGWIAGEGATRPRALSGGGFGARLQIEGVTANLAVAWPISGGTPRSDPVRREPRVWFSVGVRF